MGWVTMVLPGAVMVWSAIQVVYLAIALSSSPPSPGAELMLRPREPEYTAFLAVHALIFFVSALALALEVRSIWRWVIKRLNMPEKPQGGGEALAGTLYLALYFFPVWALLDIFLVSIGYPRYEVFVDLPAESIVRRDTHLLPPGIKEDTVPFSEVGVITGGGSSTDYSLYANTRNRRRIEIGQGDKAEMSSLARAIADKSGIGLDLR